VIQANRIKCQNNFDPSGTSRWCEAQDSHDLRDFRSGWLPQFSDLVQRFSTGASHLVKNGAKITAGRAGRLELMAQFR
jgi:hypothetical protein